MPFQKLQGEALPLVLSYALTIELAASLAAVCALMHQTVRKPASWAGAHIFAHARDVAFLENHAQDLVTLWSLARKITLTAANLPFARLVRVEVVMIWKWCNSFFRTPAMPPHHRVFSSRLPVAEKTSFTFVVDGYIPRFRLGVANTNNAGRILSALHPGTGVSQYNLSWADTSFLHGSLGADEEDLFEENAGFLLNDTALSADRLLLLPSSCSGNFDERTLFLVTLEVSQSYFRISLRGDVFFEHIFPVAETPAFLADDLFLAVVLSDDDNYDEIRLTPFPCSCCMFG